MFISDFAGIFLDANDAFLHLLGYTRAELQARAIQRGTLTPPEFHVLSQDAVNALQEKGASGTYEKEYLHKSGKRIQILDLNIVQNRSKIKPFGGEYRTFSWL